ncbi:FGGY-family carbohydrate kinase [Caldichromatium japonicum]|uniref:FGGY-family carbohydrate kinase n=1 Tax=Caldichromatium japonicum TaxID=2699430 RepID=A0A6G7VDZ5_9GAMM|nr:FGGY-family carbohydrate kinase [Caldichromatium japonicum]QIK38241.1 FGGY-family carbohydrate kinase [Caldichromatium japonicum]
MSSPRPAVIGLDLGTSGCRGVAIDDKGTLLAEARAELPAPLCPAPGWFEQDPYIWQEAVLAVLEELARQLKDHCPQALCIAATSGTLLLADENGGPLGPALMYNDCRAQDQAKRIAALAPAESAIHGPTSGLAKLLYLYEHLGRPPQALALHQGDWLSGLLGGRFASDWNNALKLGYDAECLTWPDWVRALIPSGVRLPEVLVPGTPIGALDPEIARRLHLPADLQVLAGTTDSTAAAYAAGLQQPGDALTVLGSTLVIKILAERPITDRRYGVYSQRFGDHWLVGGASNSGGAVLRQFFADQEIAALSALIDPERPSGLDYYPLTTPGERFPRPDPQLAPRLEPRPADPAQFLCGLLEGIARIEAEGYARLAELGAPRLRRVLTAGGGAVNPVWMRIRARLLGVPVNPAERTEAAVGAARLACREERQVDR